MRIFILVFSTFYSILVTSQELLLSYEDAISMALEQNIAIKQQKNQLKVNQAEKQQSIANFLPGINASGNGNRTDGRQWSDEESAVVNTSIDRANYSIGTSMTIFNGLRNVYQLKQSNQLYIAQKKQVERSIQDVIFQASQQFLQILLDKELLLIAEKNFEVQKSA